MVGSNNNKTKLWFDAVLFWKKKKVLHLCARCQLYVSDHGGQQSKYEKNRSENYLSYQEFVKLYNKLMDNKVEKKK